MEVCQKTGPLGPLFVTERCNSMMREVGFAPCSNFVIWEGVRRSAAFEAGLDSKSSQILVSIALSTPCAKLEYSIGEQGISCFGDSAQF